MCVCVHVNKHILVICKIVCECMWRLEIFPGLLPCNVSTQNLSLNVKLTSLPRQAASESSRQTLPVSLPQHWDHRHAISPALDMGDRDQHAGLCVCMASPLPTRLLKVTIRIHMSQARR